MRIQVQLKETAQPIEHEAVNAYTKGPFYCVYVGPEVHKYPLADIWRVTEDYGVHASRSTQETDPE